MNTQQLTFTRFIAAILIVIYHFGNNVIPFSHDIIAPVIHNANLGVTYFFILSGFVMIIAYGNKEKSPAYGNYLQNRAARILPLYYLAMAMMLVYYFIRIKLLHVSSRYTPTVPDVLSNLFLIQTWMPGDATSVNTAAWSLSAEAFFYLMFPALLAGLYKKKRFEIVFVYVVLFFICSQIALYFLSGIFPSLAVFFTYNPLLRIGEFLLGNVTGLIFLKADLRKSKITVLTIILSVAAFVILYGGLVPHHLLRPLFAIYFSVLLYCIAISNGFITTLFKNKFLIYLGEISYGIYILQFPVYFFFTAILSFAGYKINDPLFFVYLIILVIFSGLSYRYVEVPARDWLRNIKFKSKKQPVFS